VTASPDLLTPRWRPLIPLKQQLGYWDTPFRFTIVPAGRRSGKTERAKRRLVKKALFHNRDWPGRFAALAPTYNQAKAIYWEDLKGLIPKWALVGEPRESDLSISLVNGSMIYVMGMERPERVEGRPWDHLLLDEYANMKEKAWSHHVRPALSDRKGTADLIGVPEGRNHYYRMYKGALVDETKEWGVFTWKSAEILDITNPGEVEAARRELDPLTFEQEYEGSFVSFSGMAYYAFNERDHYRKCRYLYDAHQPLIFTFDFNVAPGVANILQELPHPDVRGYAERRDAKAITLCIGEVHIPRNSSTPAICNKLIADWGKHKGLVYCYGDATGGSKGTAKVMGSDWDLIKQILRPTFGERLHFRVKSANPSERSRVNAVNSRLKTTTKEVRFVIDPATCPHTTADFEGTALLEGGSGEIDKRKDPERTHHTDGIGYYIEYEFPVRSSKTKIEELVL
jgi:hypothetical protein